MQLLAKSHIKLYLQGTSSQKVLHLKWNFVQNVKLQAMCSLPCNAAKTTQSSKSPDGVPNTLYLHHNHPVTGLEMLPQALKMIEKQFSRWRIVDICMVLTVIRSSSLANCYTMSQCTTPICCNMFAAKPGQAIPPLGRKELLDLQMVALLPLDLKHRSQALL